MFNDRDYKERFFMNIFFELERNEHYINIVLEYYSTLGLSNKNYSNSYHNRIHLKCNIDIHSKQYFSIRSTANISINIHFIFHALILMFHYHMCFY